MNDLALIEQCLNGETNSFDELVCRYQSQLIRFLRVKCFCESEAEDVFQETFISAHRYLKSYDSKYAFSTWLFNIAINIVNRRGKKNSRYQLFIDEDEIALLESPADKPEQELEKQYKHNIWWQAKRALTSEQLDLLWFTYAEDLTGKQVANILERSLPWVKMNLIRSKSALKAHLKDTGLEFSDLVVTAEQ